MIDLKCSCCGKEIITMLHGYRLFNPLEFVGIEGYLWKKKYYVYKVCKKCHHIEKTYLSRLEAYSYDAMRKSEFYGC